jgi:hypothetical protein
VKSILIFLGVLVAAVVGLRLASPARGQALLARAAGYLDPSPEFEFGGTPETAAAPALGSTGAPPEWRAKERAAWLLYEAGDFAGAAAGWVDAAGKAPATDASRLRARADRANVFRLLSEGAAPVPGADPAASEADYRRRLDALKVPTAGAYLELADWAAARGLRGHLAFLFERAFERRSSADNSVNDRVTLVVRRRRSESAAPPPKDVLESLIRDMPQSEAADLAREETGAASGPSGIDGATTRRGDVNLSAADRKKLEEADKAVALGDAEYRAAVPGSRDVNKHRRAALDAFSKARGIYEEIDKTMGAGMHQKEIHDLNRNIAELRKDLPVGK